MTCDIPEEKLWSWIDRHAPELGEHLAVCPRCRERAARIQGAMATVADAADPIAAALPLRVGPYVVVGPLGEGGQALVYRAEQQTPHRLVALKVLKGGCLVGADDIRHFQREIQTLAALSHPAIATIYDAGRTSEGQHYFAMELVEGLPLDEYASQQNLAESERLDLFCAVCTGVQYAHEQGVIHRDLKPSNILVNRDGQPKILDFGLARLTNTDVTITNAGTLSGQLVGTLRYMSPGQARGNPAEIDERTDVYSLGVILYELLTDHPPYELSHLIPAAVAIICERPPRRPSAINPAVRRDLETVVLKALEKEPGRRYDSVAALCADVQHYLAGEPIQARPPSGLYVLRKRITKHRWAGAAAAVLLVAGVVAPFVRVRIRELHTADTRHALVLIQRDLEAGRESISMSAARGPYDEHPEITESALVWAQAQYRLGRQSGDQWQVNEAIGTLCSAGRLGRGGPAQLLLAEIYETTDPSRVADLRAQATATVSDSAEDWYLRSFATLDTRAAQLCVSTAVRRDSLHSLAWERLAYLSLLNNDADRALQAAAKLKALGDRHHNWDLFEAHVVCRQERFEEAIRLCTRLADDPTHRSHAIRCRALAHLCLRDYDAALADYNSVITARLAKTARFPYYLRATVLWILGHREAAADDYHRVGASQGFTSYERARLFLVLRDSARQHAAAGRIAAAETANSDADGALATGLRGATAGSWIEKIMLCLGGRLSPAELVRAANPQNPEQCCEGFYYAGEACLLSSNHNEAREWFRQCKETHLLFDRDEYPPDPMNEYHLAVWRLTTLAPPPASGP